MDVLLDGSFLSMTPGRQGKVEDIQNINTAIWADKRIPIIMNMLCKLIYKHMKTDIVAWKIKHMKDKITFLM